MTIVDSDRHLAEPEAGILRRAFGSFPSGVVALCARVGGRLYGFAASSFAVGISMQPALVTFSAQKSSTTWPVLRTAQRIGVSVLGSEHGAVCRQLASGREDRFADVPVHTGALGAVFISGSPTWMECTVLAEVDAGDHVLVVLRVQGLRVEETIEPLVYHQAQFRRLAS